MDGEMSSVIKNLIHIDKNANEIREKFRVEIENRKRQIELEIENLKRQIVDEELVKIEAYEREEIGNSRNKAQELIDKANKESEGLEKRYYETKEKLISQVFDELFNVGD